MKKATLKKKPPRGGPRARFEEQKHPRKGGKFTDKPGGDVAGPKIVPKVPGDTLKSRQQVAIKHDPDIPGYVAPEKRAFQGKQVALTNKLSKQEAGDIGEKIAIAHMRSTFASDARPLNAHIANYPVDVIGDHSLIEVKTGLVSNSKAAQQWRATIGQPGKAETAALKLMSPEKKKAHNARKKAQIMVRKNKVLAEKSAEHGVQMKPRTVTVILNPDTKTADIFEYDGFHSRIGWTGPDAQAAYVRTVRYE